MEMGSRSLAGFDSSKTASPSANQSDDGLKFGYFEDAVTMRPKPGAGSTSSMSGASSRKIQSGQQQPPRCQVEGCKVDLSDAKAYYSRHRVCGMHSKSPTVIVAGLEQRFCQQCSRFHQLPEFDQGKRSCRRRLAGHNERRRKLPPGSVLLSRYGRLSSTTFGTSSTDNSGRGILLDFGAYPRLAGRDKWQVARVSEQVAGNRSTAPGRPIPPWQNSSQSLTSDVFLQDSTSIRAGFPSSGIPPGECFARGSVADSNCALSLLSNQSWGSRNGASGLGMENLLNSKRPPVAQSTGPHHGAAINPYANDSWSFKCNGSGSSSDHMSPNLELIQFQQPPSCQVSGELELSQHNRRQQYMELEHSGAYGTSAQHMHWSL